MELVALWLINYCLYVRLSISLAIKILFASDPQLGRFATKVRVDPRFQGVKWARSIS